MLHMCMVSFNMGVKTNHQYSPMVSSANEDPLFLVNLMKTIILPHFELNFNVWYQGTMTPSFGFISTYFNQRIGLPLCGVHCWTCLVDYYISIKFIIGFYLYFGNVYLETFRVLWEGSKLLN
jgi:hypothetical protein